MKFKHHLDFLSIITFSFTFAVIQSEDIDFTPSNEEIGVEKHNNQFDFMLFAQIWPISGCLEWEERSQDNTCYLPNRKNWTVHGIWPSKYHKMGPFHCNHVKFNEGILEPILEELNIRWTNVRAKTPEDQFWKHEWDKHGTCAMQLESMSNELKFFSKGLELNQKFPIGEYLAANDIVPGGEYTGETIVNALKPYLDGKSPGLQCDLLHEISNPVLYQISICFDKEFNIIGCEKSAGGIYGKCKQSEVNKYPKNEILPNRQGFDSIATVFGVFIGILIIGGILCFLLKVYVTRQRRYQQYDAL